MPVDDGQQESDVAIMTVKHRLARRVTEAKTALQEQIIQRLVPVVDELAAIDGDLEPIKSKKFTKTLMKVCR